MNTDTIAITFPKVKVNTDRENTINDRARGSMLSSDDGCNRLKNVGGEVFSPKSIEYSG